MRRRFLTPYQAKLRFESYLKLNEDLEENVAKIMASFATAPYVTALTMRDLLGGTCGQTWWRDRAFFWWNAFNLSDLSEYWDDFVRRRNAGERVSSLLVELKNEVGPEAWALFSRRMGKEEPLRPSLYWHAVATSSIWTKGGTWHTSSPMTTLLVLKQHLPERELWKPFMRKLGHSGVRLLELELMDLIDPDTQLAPNARTRACDYVRVRLPELIGRGNLLGPRWLPWFFMQNIPYQSARWRSHTSTRPGNMMSAAKEIVRWEF